MLKLYWQTMWYWWRLALVAILSYIAYKLLVFFKADGDLTVISKRMKPEYFKGKVIWITGASSGSEYMYIIRMYLAFDFPSSYAV